MMACVDHGLCVRHTPASRFDSEQNTQYSDHVGRSGVLARLKITHNWGRKKSNAFYVSL